MNHQHFFDAITEGDSVAALRQIEDARASGLSVSAIFIDLIAPAMAQVGQLWSSGQLSVAREHLASGVTAHCIDALRNSAARHTPLEKRVLVSCVPGEYHDLGARMVATLLYLDGWQVDFLGSNTPVEDLCRFAAEVQPDLIALSMVILKNGRERLSESIQSLRQAGIEAPIMIGGSPGIDAETFGATAAGQTASEALLLARKLVGLQKGQAQIDEVLELLGQRVHALRKQRGWSQRALADSSGLDRTYISAVERGRQNLTIGAVVKLSQALNTTPGQLLANNCDPGRPLP